MKKFKHILLIDDDPISNRIGEKLIRRLDIAEQTNCVLNGKDALAFLKVCTQPPDVIFLDLNMPLMDGYGFLEAFQKLENKGKTDIVILTSSTASQDLQRIQQFGIKFYLSKPLLDQNLKKICEIVQAEKQPKFVMLGS